nr:hypothetical protein [Tanacetum cinerariifolium]
MDFVRFAIRELEIHSLMIQIRILSMILKIFSTTLYNPSTRRILQAFRVEQHQPEIIQEFLRKLLNDLQILNGIILERGEHTTQIITPSWNCHVFYDDDVEYSIQYREYLKNSSNAITPDLPTEELENSLSMGDEHLDTIPETKSDEVIKSSVEDLVPIPSESEGILDNMCDVPFSDKKTF